MKSIVYLLIAFSLVQCTVPEKGNSKEALASWNDVKSKNEIIAFVNESVDPNSAGFIPEEDRIATFDNDGTLWSEQPLYFQLVFAIDQIKSMASDHPEWDTIMPYSAILNNDREALMSSGMEGLFSLMMTSHSGMSSVEFDAMVRNWVATARHPRFDKPYNELVYQPMLELLQYLQENKFKTYIVSGGGVDFMRPLVSEVYNIPPEQIIGSTIKTKFVYNDGSPEVMRLPELFFNDDKEGKPENIERIIGRKPVMSVGNSDGDLQMLQWAASNDKFLNIYVHHTDNEREWAYDRDSHIGRFDKGLDQAIKDGWTLVDMKADWKVIYPFQLLAE